VSKRAEAAAAIQDAQAAAEARVGTALDAKWTLDSLLGRGGMATVYGATHKTTKARAAVKVLHREFAQDEDVSQRFLREARIANSIQHASKVGVLDEGMSDQGEIFLVMELLQGTTLDSYMKGPGRGTNIEQRLRIFDPILELLGECHTAGIIHRDIKPANIFMTDSGRVKVLDFGIARLRETQTSIDPTRQGTVLGTPAYMAPEQALGLMELVDGRADLWSVGACIYAVLSGQRVHRARSENESMVLAATKSAESIALIMPDLPVEVVAFVDKSLAHDRSHRFPNAAAMRAELNTLIAALRTGQVTNVKQQTPRGDAVVVRSQVVADPELEASAELKAAALERLKSIWKHIGVHLTAVQQYGPTHNASLQPIRLAHEETGQALAWRPDSVVWDISPYGFTFQKTLLWDQDRPQLERAAYKLFSFGLRKVQLRPGITEAELRRLLAILLGDPTTGYRLSDDPVAELWAERFEHVAHLAIDSFAVGNADDLEAFENEAAEVARDAADLAMITKGRDDHLLDSLEARAMQANLMSGMNVAANVAAAIAIDIPTRAALGAQVLMPDDRWMDRFIDATAVGLGTAAKESPAAEAMKDAMAAWAADQIASGQSTATFQFLAALGEGLGAVTVASTAAAIEYELTRRMFEPSRFDELLRKAVGDDGLDSRLVGGVVRLLAVSTDDAYFESAVTRYVPTLDPRLLAALKKYITQWVPGREMELGKVLETGEASAAMQMLGLLSSLPTKEAAAAVARGLKNPSSDVRLAALEKVTPDTPQADLQGLLSDAVQQVRCEALRVIGKLRLRTLGPALVRRIQQDSFAVTDDYERKEWLQCLHILNPVRAEELAVAMISNAPMIRDDKNERSRVIAAEVLARAESAEALAAVRKAARAVWWNGPLVREAAEKAAVAIEARREGKGAE
jgi:serine/threonine protein kinase